MRPKDGADYIALSTAIENNSLEGPIERENLVLKGFRGHYVFGTIVK